MRGLDSTKNGVPCRGLMVRLGCADNARLTDTTYIGIGFKFIRCDHGVYERNSLSGRISPKEGGS